MPNPINRSTGIIDKTTNVPTYFQTKKKLTCTWYVLVAT